MKRKPLQSGSVPTRSDISYRNVACEDVHRFVHRCLTRAGADDASSKAVTRALVGTSCRGVDTHGVRLLPHYIRTLQEGRINGNPQLTYKQLSGGTGRLDADDGFGHLAGYRAVEECMLLAEANGIGAVTVTNSSHFGAAGCYPLFAAESGYLGLALCNADKVVLAYDGVNPFHGTNPISFAAPVANSRPYLIDMATSSIPLNRVLQYREVNRSLPRDVAVDSRGEMTTDPNGTVALLPIGGASYGFKGAALAGMCDILSSALTGMAFSNHLLSMGGPDYTTRRHLGHFFLVMKPDAFIDVKLYQQLMDRYLAEMRTQPSRPESRVMAPGDREWAEEKIRRKTGIPVDSAVWDELSELAMALGVEPLMHSSTS